MREMPIGKDEAVEFDEEFVKPTLKEFELDQFDRRRCVAAALMVNSFADHVFEARRAPRFAEHDREAAKKAFISSISSGKFKIVRAIANATKHAVARKLGKTGPVPLVRTMSALRPDRYVEEGYVVEGYTEEGVFAFVDGKDVLLLPIIRTAAEHLRRIS